MSTTEPRGGFRDASLRGAPQPATDAAATDAPATDAPVEERAAGARLETHPEQPHTSQLDQLARRALALLGDRPRIILGITGSPGAGKTTLAVQVAARISELAARGATGQSAGHEGGEPAGASDEASIRPRLAVHLPMDGYHLANSTLDRLGIHDRKGAIDTFDGWGFLALLQRLLVELDHTVYAPSFDRSVDEGIAGEIAVAPDARIIVVEGNYLLVDQPPWASVAGLLAETWFCDTSEAERLRRLIDRHERHGRSPEAAAAWATTVDGANALLIEASRPRATLIVSGVDPSARP